MGLPANVGFGRVTGRLIRAILDGPIDPDAEPDGVPIEGAKVTFTASVGRNSCRRRLTQKGSLTCQVLSR